MEICKYNVLFFSIFIEIFTGFICIFYNVLKKLRLLLLFLLSVVLLLLILLLLDPLPPHLRISYYCFLFVNTLSTFQTSFNSHAIFKSFNNLKQMCNNWERGGELGRGRWSKMGERGWWGLVGKVEKMRGRFGERG